MELIFFLLSCNVSQNHKMIKDCIIMNNHGKKKMGRAIKNDLCITHEAETEKI